MYIDGLTIPEVNTFIDELYNNHIKDISENARYTEETFKVSVTRFVYSLDR